MTNTTHVPVYWVDPEIHTDRNTKGAVGMKYHKVHDGNHKNKEHIYRVLNYDKNASTANEYGIYRSVVVYHDTMDVVAFSPPKSVPLQSFIKEFSLDLHAHLPESIVVNEIVEGTMINLWYNKYIGQWEISTKSGVGGDYAYFRDGVVGTDGTYEKFNTTFLHMFLDAMVGANYNVDAPHEELTRLINGWLWDTSYCYSFVLQHPQNHIVFHISSPRAYLVALYQIEHIFERDTVDPHAPIKKYLAKVTAIPQSTFRTWVWLTVPQGLHIPQVYTPPSLGALCESYHSIHCRDNTVGVMLTHLGTGRRTKIVSPVYKEYKELRGNNASLVFHFLCIRSIGKVDHFLTMFPWYAHAFAQFQRQLTQWMIQLHLAYMQRYIQRTVKKVSPRYKHHIQAIHHHIFLPSMAEGKKRVVTLQVVEEYVNALTPMDLYHVLVI